jgi:SP family facilitated glucose transporter-like MFS transporter 8
MLQVIITCIAMAVIDKLGRRILLLVSAILMSISCAGLAIYFIMIQHDMSPKAFAWLPLTFVVLYILAFAIGFGPVPWVVMGEIFSNEVCLVFIKIFY